MRLLYTLIFAASLRGQILAPILTTSVSGGGGTPIAQVGSAATADATAGATATTTGFDTTGATLLVITLSNIGDASLASVSDSKGNTWHALTNRCAASTVCTNIWYAWDHGGSPLSVGASHTVSASGSYATLVFSAWSGTKTASDPLDSTAGQSTNANTSSQTIQPGSITPSVNGSLVITSGQPAGVISFSIDSPFTVTGTRSNVISNGMGHSIQTTASAANPTWNFGTVSSSNSATIAAFNPQ